MLNILFSLTLITKINFKMVTFIAISDNVGKLSIFYLDREDGEKQCRTEGKPEEVDLLYKKSPVDEPLYSNIKYASGVAVRLV